MEQEMNWWLSIPAEEPYHPMNGDRDMLDAIMNGFLEPPTDGLAPPI